MNFVVRQTTVFNSTININFVVMRLKQKVNYTELVADDTNCRLQIVYHQQAYLMNAKSIIILD